MQYYRKLKRIEDIVSMTNDRLDEIQKSKENKKPDRIAIYSLLVVMLTSIGGWVMSYQQMKFSNENARLQVSFDKVTKKYEDFVLNLDSAHYYVFEYYELALVPADDHRQKWKNKVIQKADILTLYFENRQFHVKDAFLSDVYRFLNLVDDSLYKHDMKERDSLEQTLRAKNTFLKEKLRLQLGY